MSYPFPDEKWSGKKSSILYSIERTLSRKFFERLRGAVYCIAVGPTLHFFQLSVMGIIHCLPGKNMRAKLLRICHLLPILYQRKDFLPDLGFQNKILAIVEGRFFNSAL